MSEDFKWTRENIDEFQQKYSGMYVAVHKGKVIASGDFKKVYEEVNRKKVDAIIKYVFPGDLVVL